MNLLNHPIILSHIHRSVCFKTNSLFQSDPNQPVLPSPYQSERAQILSTKLFHPQIHLIVPPFYSMCVSSVSIIVIFPRRLPKGSLYPKPVPPTGDATSGPSTYTPALFYHTSTSKRVHLRSSCTRETFSTHASLQLLLFLLACFIIE